MVDTILTGAGFVHGKTYIETGFRRPPTETYAIYLDDKTVRGSDSLNLVEEHSVSIELYEYSKDPEAEARIEAQFNALGLNYQKQARYWLEDEQLYQVVYTFDYIRKGV